MIGICPFVRRYMSDRTCVLSSNRGLPLRPPACTMDPRLVCESLPARYVKCHCNGNSCSAVCLHTFNSVHGSAGAIWHCTPVWLSQPGCLTVSTHCTQHTTHSGQPDAGGAAEVSCSGRLPAQDGRTCAVLQQAQAGCTGASLPYCQPAHGQQCCEPPWRLRTRC